MALTRAPKKGTLRQDIGARLTFSREPANFWKTETEAQVDYLMCTPEMAREITNRWISDVPSKMV
jgi:hypothetical protein